jgi:uncharacterized membrane protein
MEIIKIITLMLNIIFGLYYTGLYYKTKDNWDLFLAALNILAVLLYLTH